MTTEAPSAVDWASVVARIKTWVAESHPAGASRPPLVEALVDHVGRATTAWPLRVDYSPGPVDRRADLLSGPLYTSARHPWPREDGKWCEPVLQIDLERWGALAGRDVGRGLLQLWDPHTGGLLRTIPPEDLAEPAAAVPSSNGDDYPSVIGDTDWATRRPDWLDRPGRIVGFGEPFLDVAPWHLRRHIGVIADPQYDDEAEEDPLLRARLRELLAEIGNFDAADVHRAFGMCGGNVFVEAENLPPVLVTIENDERVYSTMGSTLCVCVEWSGDRLAHSAHLFWE